MKRAVKQATPYGLLRLRERRWDRRRRAVDREVAGRVRAARGGAYSYEEAIRFLSERGLDEREVREGSIPEASLEFVRALVEQELPRERALLGLHVGNFVGVSLGYLTAALRELQPDSLVVSIDPNIRHRGVEHPQDHVLALLARFDLLGNSLVIPGYTLEQNFGDEWTDDLERRYAAEPACERVLRALARLGPPRFDVVLLDGNHDDAYLGREFAALRRMLAAQSVVVFDDVEIGAWPGVGDLFRRVLDDEPRTFADLGKDGRVGVLQVRSAEAAFR